MDVTQWTKTFKAAGLTGLVLTCKHHDGFCLWPSEYTEHSVKNSPYKDGKGNVVDEVEKASRADGLKFGVYLSPWDRNRADYGTPSYVEYYRNQLKELFTAHKPVFEMWFDGANGGDSYYGGANEKRKIDGKTYYDWPNTLELIRGMEPNVIFFSDAGPDIRWCGNERGYVNETNWNTITADTLYAGKGGIQELLNTGEENGTSWIPAEVDVSIRPGWFYHSYGYRGYSTRSSATSGGVAPVVSDTSAASASFSDVANALSGRFQGFCSNMLGELPSGKQTSSGAIDLSSFDTFTTDMLDSLGEGGGGGGYGGGGGCACACACAGCACACACAGGGR